MAEQVLTIATYCWLTKRRRTSDEIAEFIDQFVLDSGSTTGVIDITLRGPRGSGNYTGQLLLKG